MTLDPVPAGRRLDIAGTYNFREVAPGLLRPGTLYRSDALHRLTAEGRRSLAALDLARIVDLRSELDRRIGGRDRLRGVRTEYISIPIRGVGRTVDLATLDLRAVYHWVLERDGARVGAVIRAVAEADGAVLVHCTAGKDRTGLVSALILTAIGVDYEAVAADYILTESNLAGPWADAMLRKVRRFRVPVTDNLVEVLVRSPEPVLRESFEWLEARYGGVRPYLSTIGVDDAVVERLRAGLVPA